MNLHVFFYGLFMDEVILVKNGIKATNPRKGYLNGYALKIGNRASLIPSKNEKAYGIVMTIDADKIQDLYAEASVSDYIPEEVTIILKGNETIKAMCYNLPPTSLTGTNTAYAQSLYALAKQLDFPEDYLTEIKQAATQD
ncbi:gamma-glutamylcyclotransferase [Ekhidna sp.]|uniref:gamma-glutamylcyclotransferase n=1 Tax=Ekhidna sp. TaxID=2608089 RepID=UPI00329918F3